MLKLLYKVLKIIVSTLFWTFVDLLLGLFASIPAIIELIVVVFLYTRFAHLDKEGIVTLGILFILGNFGQYIRTSKHFKE